MTVLRDRRGSRSKLLCGIQIEVQTVEYRMMDDQIGYISVSEFDDVTYDQFKTALDDLEGQKMRPWSLI